MSIRVLGSLALLCLVSRAPVVWADPLPSLPQVSAAQAARAVALSRLPALKLLRNAFVVPHWIARTNQLWYRRETEAGVDWVVVEASSGSSRTIFDEQTLRAAANAAGAAISDEAPVEVTSLDTDSGTSKALVLSKGQLYQCQDSPQISCAAFSRIPDTQTSAAPDGQRSIFLRDDNLWIRDVTSGLERALTQDGTPDFAYGFAGYDRERAYFVHLRSHSAPPPVGITWSPDGRRVLVPRIDVRHVTPYPWLESSPVDESHRPLVRSERIALVGERPAVWQWWIIDVESGVKRPVLFPQDAALLDQRRLYRTQWTADSSRIFTTGAGHRFEARTLFEINAANGTVRALWTDRSMAQDGSSEDLPFRILHNDREVMWATVRDDYLHLDLRDLRSGRTLEKITRGSFHVRAILGVDEKADRIYFVANGREPGDPYNRYVYAVNFKGGALTLLTPEPADHQVLDSSASNAIELQDETPAYEALSPDAHYIAYAYSTVDEPTRFAIRRTSDGSLVSVYEHADASALLAAGYHPPERFVTRSADGRADLWGLVYRPGDFDPSHRYAVIDAQYVSPIAQVAPHNFNGAISRQFHFANSPATAELGFIVIVVDGRGTPFRSRSFSGPRPDFLATMGLDDHIQFIRALSQRDSSIDLERIGIVGASFGGWTVLRALLQFPQFYKVGAAGTAPGSFYAMPEFPELTLTAGAARYQGDTLLRPTPEAVPQNWGSFDNLAQVDRLTGKLLMFIGEQDEHVLPGSSLQFFDRAVAAQKDVWLIQIPNAQHNVVGYPYVMREAMAFLLRNLNGTSLPPGMTLPSPVPFKLDPRVPLNHADR